MLMTIYKLMAKIIATRLSLLLVALVSPHQHGFIKGSNIYENILTTMVGLEYAQFTNHKCILLQLNLDKEYDSVTWSFVFELLKNFGFGP